MVDTCRYRCNRLNFQSLWGQASHTPKHDIKDFATGNGISFASAGTGYDNATSNVMELPAISSESFTSPELGRYSSESFLQSNGLFTIGKKRTVKMLFGSECMDEYNNMAKD
ncbi:hypothetical protein V6N12_015247 [Hibiscus sabdariffa]|uniref:Uncharacterized protein n=1 Tax=Hibiscus sabdariffa TaxID=183260 RepID=A0ABR2DNU1_9ROSI